MIDTVFGIKVRMSGLSITRYRPIIGRLLNADYRPADNRPLPHRCISSLYVLNDVQGWCKLSVYSDYQQLLLYFFIVAVDKYID